MDVTREITREEAIANLNMISVAFVEPVTKEQRKLIDDTFDMAIKALEQEPCEDCISRQEVIDEIYESRKNFNNEFDQGFFADKIKALSPVNPQEPKTEQFAEWVAREIFDDMWDYNKDAFAEIACRKLAKLGIVRAKGDKWELVDSKEGEGGMTYKENITAILECYFTGFKKEIIDSACNRILEQESCEGCDYKEWLKEEQEPKTGHWIEKDGFDGDVYYDCSECGESWTTIEGTPWNNGMKYCPNCGARMTESEEV